MTLDPIHLGSALFFDLEAVRDRCLFTAASRRRQTAHCVVCPVLFFRPRLGCIFSFRLDRSAGRPIVMCCRLLPAAGPCLSMKKAQRLDFVVLSQINAIKSTNAAFRRRRRPIVYSGVDRKSLRAHFASDVPNPFPPLFGRGP